MALPPQIQRLADFIGASGHDKGYLKRIPRSRQAAVFVLLYEVDSVLRVLLTTRAQTLRTHAGRTAFPGGKCDASDEDVIQTAVREAHEEVGLPTPSEDFQILGLFPPHPFHKLVVTPVLAYTPKPDAVLSQLKASEAEVEHIFSHPLEAFIDPPLASKYGTELVERGGSDWTFEEEFHYFKDYVLAEYGDAGFRYHHFRSSASPITGLTANVLQDVAEIAFGRQTTFERFAKDEPRTFEEWEDKMTKAGHPFSEEGDQK